jgi:4-amino-4-deoxy-L-arabinose transferase-like glycosyltransferase
MPDAGSGAVITFVRVVVSLVSAGTVAVFFDWLRRVFESRTAGLVGAALLLANPVFRSCQSLMLPDPLAAFFAVLALRALTRWNREYGLAAHWSETLIVGVLLGVAVSTRLYAVALVVPVAVLLILKLPAFPSKTLASAAVITVASLAVFAGTNPLLLMRPKTAVLEMTSRHLLRAGDSRGGVNPGQIPYIVEIPFDTLRPRAYPNEGILDDPENTVRGPDNPRLPWSLGLAALGVAIAARRRAWLPILWAISAYLVVGRVVAAMNPTWIMAKVFLLPAIGICALQAAALSSVAAALRRRPRPANPASRDARRPPVDP